MAQLLLVKTANTPLKTVGDLIGVFDDTHIFSTTEKEVFTILKVDGERADFTAKLLSNRIEVEQVYRASTTGWAFEKPEQKEVWKDTDKKWKDVAIPPKYEFSLSELTEAEKTAIVNGDAGADAAIKKMTVNPGTWDEKNRTEVITAIREIS